jgi:hypothetical protein
MIKFMKKENMTIERTNLFLTNIIEGKIGTIDIRDRNTLIWPISQCLEMTSFERNWNEKYPEKFPLISIENQWIEEIANNLQRKNNVNCLPFKKRIHDIPINTVITLNNNKIENNELELLTEEDIQWLDSLSKNPTLITYNSPEYSQETFQNIEETIEYLNMDKPQENKFWG